MSLENVTHSNRLYGTSSSGASPTSYEEPWEDQIHEVTTIPRVISQSPKPANIIARLNALQVLSRAGDSFSPNVITFDQEGSTTANTEQEDTYKIIIRPWSSQSWSKHEILEKHPIRVHWDKDQTIKAILLTPDSAKDLMVKWSNSFRDWLASSTILNPMTGSSYTYTTTLLDASVVSQWKIKTAIKSENLYKTIIQSKQRLEKHKREILERFAVLAQREDDWDERGSKKPTQTILVHAKHLIIEELLDTITSAGHEWLTPFISSDEDGYITVSWYRKKRTLHIEIEENEAEYTKIWRENTNMKMEADLLDCDNYLTLWKWLLDEQK